jgi:uncharacterized zinc-type alcohol dehydrogenase-like protein
MKTKAYAAMSAKSALAPFTIERRDPKRRDVAIDIVYCGVCHSDIHQARGEWPNSIFPMVPGHEIVGRVSAVGAEVKKYRAGDTVGVGCLVDSCRECEPCRAGDEQYCERGWSLTYNGYEQDGKTPTYGGYATRIVVSEDFVVKIPDRMPLDRAAPLLCAGITTYSPLRHWNVAAGQEVGVVGLGGLGHMGVKLAKAMGAKVSVLSHSPAKREDALRLGADDFIATREEKAFEQNARRFHFILDTVSAAHDYNSYLNLLRRDATMVLVGLPPSSPLDATPLVFERRRLAGSAIGGLRETQEMLDFCAARGVVADIETIPIHQINEAYERMIRGDVRYRFVIDNASLET